MTETTNIADLLNVYLDSVRALDAARPRLSTYSTMPEYIALMEAEAAILRRETKIIGLLLNIVNQNEAEPQAASRAASWSKEVLDLLHGIKRV